MRLRLRAVGSLLLVVAACSDGTSPPASPGAPPAGRITVQLSGGEGEVKAFRDLVAAFERDNPGTTVEVVPGASQGDHVAKLATAFAAGNPPDVFLVNYRRMGRFASSGVIEPPAFDASGLYAGPVEAFTFGGRLLCLPQNASSSVVYYNPSLFARAGVAVPEASWTWAGLKATAAALAAKKVEAIGFETGIRTVAPFTWSDGGDVVDDPAEPTRVSIPEAPLRYLLDLQAYGLDATEREASPPDERFARGELAMFVDSRRAVPSLRSAGVDFDVLPLPRGRAGSVSLLASDAYCVARKAKNPSLAQAFAAYAVGPRGGEVLARTGRTVPSLRSLAEGPAFLDPAEPPKSSRVFLDVLSTVRRLPNTAAWFEAEETATDVLDQLFAGRLSLDAARREIERKTAEVFAQQR